MNVSHWLKLKVLGLSHLHGEAAQESQMLAEQGLIWREDVEPAILPRTMWHFHEDVEGWAFQIRQRRGNSAKKRESSILCQAQKIGIGHSQQVITELLFEDSYTSAWFFHLFDASYNKQQLSISNSRSLQFLHFCLSLDLGISANLSWRKCK